MRVAEEDWLVQPKREHQTKQTTKAGVVSVGGVLDTRATATSAHCVRVSLLSSQCRCHDLVRNRQLISQFHV